MEQITVDFERLAEFKGMYYCITILVLDSAKIAQWIN